MTQEAMKSLLYASGDYTGTEHIDAFDVAISALEKQIPKKPIKHGFDPNKLISTVSYTCPACNRHLGDYAYCPDCGQALDWSDTE